LKRKLLVYSQKKRLDVDQALEHSYLKDFKGVESEATLPSLITIPLNENKKLSIKDYRDAIYSGNIIKKQTRAVSVT